MLDQETAGFITGYKAYEDEALRNENLNPDAYRDADSERLSVRWIPAADHPWAGTDFRAYLRRSGHGLPAALPARQAARGKRPVERRPDGHQPAGLSAPDNRLTSGVDVEIASGYLKETQDGDSGLGIDPARPALRLRRAELSRSPPSRRSDLPLAEAWTLQLGLRAEYMLYAYDNQMLDGNTRDDGTPCDPAPCRFNRPADRSDDFLNVAPECRPALPDLARSWPHISTSTRGFRPPQATELYRLQAQQSVADLDSETLDSAELGLHWQTGITRVELATFAMKKRNFIFQDSSRFNVSDGKTRHVGVELQADLRLPSGSMAASPAPTPSRPTPSAPRRQAATISSPATTSTRHRARWPARASASSAAPASRNSSGSTSASYYLDAGNLTTYSGHNLLNLRGVWRATKDWSVAVRINNLADKLYAERADFVSFPSASYRYFPGREREMYVEVAYGRL